MDPGVVKHNASGRRLMLMAKATKPAVDKAIIDKGERGEGRYNIVIEERVDG